MEVVMRDGTRCDILTSTYATEVDFAKKWAEAIGQSLNYAMHTGKSPAVELIVLSSSDNKYVERVRKISSRYGLGIKIFTIGGLAVLVVHLSLVQAEKKSFGILQVVSLTTAVANTMGQQRVGFIRIIQVGIAVRFVGGDGAMPE